MQTDNNWENETELQQFSYLNYLLRLFQFNQGGYRKSAELAEMCFVAILSEDQVFKIHCNWQNYS